jgi:Methyladenine glycosylase
MGIFDFLEGGDVGLGVPERGLGGCRGLRLEDAAKSCNYDADASLHAAIKAFSPRLEGDEIARRRPQSSRIRNPIPYPLHHNDYTWARPARNRASLAAPLSPHSSLDAASVAAVLIGARAYLAMQAAGEDFATFVWTMAGGRPIQGDGRNVPVSTPLSHEISEALKKRGFKFVGRGSFTHGCKPSA